MGTTKVMLFLFTQNLGGFARLDEFRPPLTGKSDDPVMAAKPPHQTSNYSTLVNVGRQAHAPHVPAKVHIPYTFRALRLSSSWVPTHDCPNIGSPWLSALDLWTTRTPLLPQRCYHWSLPSSRWDSIPTGIRRDFYS